MTAVRLSEEFGFELVLQRFVKEAGIEEMWRRVQPAIEHVIEQYHGPVSRGPEVDPILNLLTIPGYLDIALRDLGLALGAFALARLSEEYAS